MLGTAAGGRRTRNGEFSAGISDRDVPRTASIAFLRAMEEPFPMQNTIAVRGLWPCWPVRWRRTAGRPSAVANMS